MCEELCLKCERYFILDENGKPACFTCNNFSSSKYLDRLIDALASDQVDIDHDYYREFAKKCPNGKCGKVIRDNPKTILGWINLINEKIALFFTRATSNMWCAYFFFILAILGWPDTLTLASFIQWLSTTCIQLVMLAVIQVGTDLLSKASEKLSEICMRAQLKSEIEIQRLDYKIDKIINLLDKKN